LGSSLNHFKTGLLLAALAVLFGIVGLAMGGTSGLIIALIFATCTNSVAYWNADKLALRAQGAKEVDAQTAPELVQLVHALAERGGLPHPRVFLVEQAQPNAFATGRSPEKSAVAITTGLVELLTKEELAGVIAHELAHIKSRDTLTMTVAATIAGAISSFVNFSMLFGGTRNRPNPIMGLLMMVLAPMAAAIIQMTISRSREYEADRVGAEISGNPLWLASALEKIAVGTKSIPNEVAEMRPAMASLFIVNPLSGKRMDGWFSTHPKTENRILALIELAKSMGIAAKQASEALTQTSNGKLTKAQRGVWG
jgi:heat shock protein HtpX